MALEDAPPNIPPMEQPVEVSPAEQPPVKAEERQWGMFAHLAALAGLFVGGLTFVGPLIVWLIKKDQSKFVDYHGKESLNFQLNILIYYVLTMVVTLVTCGVTFPLPLAVLVYSIVMPIIAGMAANKGESYQYPLTFRIIK
jgi:uncharacterized protein